jgi:hypothetical protein
MLTLFFAASRPAIMRGKPNVIEQMITHTTDADDAVFGTTERLSMVRLGTSVCL